MTWVLLPTVVAFLAYKCASRIAKSGRRRDVLLRILIFVMGVSVGGVAVALAMHWQVRGMAVMLIVALPVLVGLLVSALSIWASIFSPREKLIGHILRVGDGIDYFSRGK